MSIVDRDHEISLWNSFEYDYLLLHSCWNCDKLFNTILVLGRREKFLSFSYSNQVNLVEWEKKMVVQRNLNSAVINILNLPAFE